MFFLHFSSHNTRDFRHRIHAQGTRASLEYTQAVSRHVSRFWQSTLFSGGYMSKPFMIFNIEIDRTLISEMQDAQPRVSVIPFTGYVRSDLFTGTILPGAADVQITDPSGCRHLQARYMFRGRDSADNTCYLYVDNTGYYRPEDHKKTYIDACPRFLTDSPLLAEYLSRPVFRSEIHGTDTGVDILVFDTAQNT